MELEWLGLLVRQGMGPSFRRWCEERLEQARLELERCEPAALAGMQRLVADRRSWLHHLRLVEERKTHDPGRSGTGA